ncbi:hypothetical protein AAVH_37165 [Aphelenchoides avenae]|nr:hypothetical protein AAVH_37165 [Aphelenchus avenae]
MELIIYAAELVAPVVPFVALVSGVALCGGGKKAANSAKAAPGQGGQAPGTPGYVSKPCNKRDGLVMEDPDLKSDKLAPTAGDKKEPSTAAAPTAATQESSKPGTSAAAPETAKA